jgi:hypothetical protein
MKLTRKQKILIFIGILFFLIVIGFYGYYNQQNGDETTEIFKKAKFSVGKVVKFKSIKVGSKHSTGESSRVTVEYNIKDSLFKGTQAGDTFFTPEYSIDENVKYLVVYDSTNPQQFRILFDSPIKDSNDFVRYIKNSRKILKDTEHYKEDLNKRIPE